jgi:hypothetical protein
MSAPIRGRERSRDQVQDGLLYAPRWARDHRPGDPGSTGITSSPPLAPGKGGHSNETPPLPPMSPRFEGDVAVEALRRQLSLDPVVMPEPPIRMRRTPWLPWLARLLATFMLAGAAAFGFTWITSRDVTSSRDPGRESRVGDSSSVVASSVQPVPLTAMPRLLVESRRGYANEPLALGVALEGKADGESLLLDGLADGTKLSAGMPIGRTGWRVPAADLGQVMAYAPQDFVGVMDAKVDLRSAHDRLMDSQFVTLEWIAKQPDAGAAPGRETNEPTAHQSLDAEEIAVLMKRAQEFLKTGDIASARLLLRRAANADSAEAALALGATFDESLLAELGVLGLRPDAVQARAWYRKAAELGSTEASRRLERLAGGSR